MLGIAFALAASSCWRLQGSRAMLGIAFALAASSCWSAADFLGGLFSRRLAVPVVLFTVQAVGLLVVGAALLAVGDPAPDGRAALAALGAGMAGVSALACFYRALAIGTMSVVAPLSATGVALPVVVGIATGNELSSVAATGLVVTVAGVMLASRETAGHHGTPAARASIVLALLAALGFGTFFIAYDVASDGSLLWAMLLVRVVGVPVLGAVVVARRSAPPSARDVPALCAAGLLDTSATGFYALANTHGALSVVAVVGSLYPVATVLLARAVLKERLTVSQAAGVAVALTGVGLIAAG